MEIVGSEDVTQHFDNSEALKTSIRAGTIKKTAQFWMQYIDIIYLILVFIQATKENDLQLHIAALDNLCPL